MGKKKGKKGKKGSKGSKKKGKKEHVDDEPYVPPDLDVFVYIRRKNLSLCLESYGEETIKDLKIQVATILRQFPEDIVLFSMFDKEPEEMVEMIKPKEEEKKKDDKSSSKGGRGRGRDAKKEKSERNISPPKPTSATLSAYGYTAATATIFNPGVIGLSYRGDDGEFEKLDVTPYGQFPVIPEEIKMHLRNYVPPPPPPPKKTGDKGQGGGKGGPKK